MKRIAAAIILTGTILGGAALATAQTGPSTADRQAASQCGVLHSFAGSPVPSDIANAALYRFTVDGQHALVQDAGDLVWDAQLRADSGVDLAAALSDCDASFPAALQHAYVA